MQQPSAAKGGARWLEQGGHERCLQARLRSYAHGDLLQVRPVVIMKGSDRSIEDRLSEPGQRSAGGIWSGDGHVDAELPVQGSEGDWRSGPHRGPHRRSVDHEAPIANGPVSHSLATPVGRQTPTGMGSSTAYR